MDGIYLLLGTNLGNKFQNIQRAKEYLTSRMVIVKKESSIYETDAWGIEDQPSFYNQVIEVDQPYTPERLLEIVLDIETKMGRQRLQKWGERIIDIDILYFDQQVVSTNTLQIPHPGIPERSFTLHPLVEISPDFPHPALQLTNTILLEACQDNLRVKKLDL